MRQARYRGTAKVQFQALTTALVVNLVRMATLIGALSGRPFSPSPSRPLHHQISLLSRLEGMIRQLRDIPLVAFFTAQPQLPKWAFRSVS